MKLTTAPAKDLAHQIATLIKANVTQEVKAQLIERATLADQLKGPWTAAAYARGDVVQRSGGLWLAMTDAKPADQPGASAAWRLILKSPPR